MSLGDLFGSRSMRVACLGHVFMAAPHPLISCIGALIAGFGWLSSKFKLRIVVSLLLFIYGFLLGFLTLYLMIIGPRISVEGFLGLIEVKGELAIFGSSAFIIGVSAYGVLAYALHEISREIGSRLFSCAAISLIFTVILLFFATALIMMSAFASNIDVLVSTLEMAIAAFISMNLIGNVLAGMGFILGMRVTLKA